MAAKPASEKELSLGVRGSCGLGGYPLVSLQEARDTALDDRRALRRGENPFATRNPLAAAVSNGAASNAPTFREAFAAYFEIHSQSWKPKTATDWQASLETYAMPTIGGKRVDAITMADVLAILKPIWNVKTDAAPRIKRRIAAVMAWAVAHGHRTDNPVASVDAVSPKQARNHEHRKALPYAEVPQAIATVRNAHRGSTSAKLALEFLILTGGAFGRSARRNLE